MTDSAANLANLPARQRRMPTIITKDNAAKIAEKIKESGALNGMKEKAVKMPEMTKESEALSEMIKESTLDKLLVGKETLD
jgi:hypothetical protein